MYHDFYQFESLPFESTPDPRFFYASEQHREALAAIEYAIRMRKGFVLVTGDIGSGKTTISRAVMQRLEGQALLVPVLHGHETGQSLLKQVVRHLELPIRKSDDHARLLERLRLRLSEQLQRGLPAVLLVDEAQSLSDEALEELRLMSNFDTATDKLVQIVLVGQPELRHRIRSGRLSALRQRIVLAKELRPMTAAETAGYIAHRIRAASRDAKNITVTFDEAAIELIHRTTGGVPRLINVACDNCLLLGFVRQAYRITPELVRRGLADMVPNFTDTPWSQSMPALGQGSGSLLLQPAPTLRMTGT